MNVVAGGNEEMVWGISETVRDSMLARALSDDLTAAMQAYFGSLDSQGEPEKPYDMDGSIAVIPVTGVLMKGYSFWCYYYGGTSMERLQRTLLAAETDPDVLSVRIVFDTPGGTVAGAFDTAKAIRRLQAVKPVEGYISDQCCSVGYLLASQCGQIVANNATAMIGNIGTLLTVDDLSKMFAMAGIERKVYKSAPLKGAGTPGTSISKAQDAEFQSIVDGSNAEFVLAVSLGRGISLEKAQSWATAHVYLGKEALAAGLIDRIDDDDAEPVTGNTASDGGDNDGDSDDLNARSLAAVVGRLDVAAEERRIRTTPLKRSPFADQQVSAVDRYNAVASPLSALTTNFRELAGSLPGSQTLRGTTPRENITASGREGMTMKEKFVRLLSALGFKAMAVAVVSATDESVESLLQTVSEQVHVEVDARIRNHPLMLACDAAGITSPEQLGQVLEMKTLGEKYIRDLRDDAKGEAIRAYGAEAGSRIGATVEKLSFHEVKALRDGWQTEADRKADVGANGEAAVRASAPKAVAVAADQPTDLKPKSAWEQLTDAQRQYATNAGYAKSDETKERFAKQYLADAGRELATA